MIFRNMYKLNDKLVKNALMESLIIVKGLTKRESKDYINKLNIDDEILNKKFKILNEYLKNDDEYKKVIEDKCIEFYNKYYINPLF